MQSQLRTFLSIFLIIIGINLQGQESLSIEYKLELVEGKVDLKEIEGFEQIGKLKGMLENARYRVMFKGDKSRMEIKSLLISMIMVNDFKLGKAIILTSALGDKSAQLIEGEEYQTLYQMSKDNKDKIALLKASKEIAGYRCEKAVITRADSIETTVWYCPKLKAKASPLNRFQSPLIDGLILEMISDFNGITVRFKADEISNKEIDEKYLGFGIPRGYELKKPDLSQLEKGL